MKLTPSFSRFLWLTGASLAAAGWLQPNHYFPWLAFHSDAWAAAGWLALSMIALAISRPDVIRLHGITLAAGAVAVLPLAQHLFGLLTSLSVAGVASAYVAGFALALILGAHTERAWSGRALDFLMLAIGIGGVVSVALQLHQWLAIDRIEVWAMGSTTDRPYANLGQPNLLGTFLIWSLLAAVWGVARGRIGLPVFVALAGYLLVGIALTESRTAMVNLALLWAATLYWYLRGRAPVRVALVATALFIAFCALLLLLPVLHSFMLTGESSDVSLRRVGAAASGSLRLQVYQMMATAALEKPWTGYGWNQGAAAQYAMAARFPPLETVFSYTHNLFLDLVVWCGIPMGAAIGLACVLWYAQTTRKVSAARDVVVWAMLTAVFVHAMLELPLYYGYLLWPAGFMMGTLNERLGLRAWVLRHSSRLLMLPLAALAVLLGLVTREYLQVEESYRAMRFEGMKIATRILPVPQLTLLDQFQDVLWLGRLEPRRGLSAQDLDRMERTCVSYPSLANMFRLTKSLALNGEAARARVWLTRMEKTMSPENLELAQRDWRHQASLYPEIASLPWGP